jgi:hypothetical protein
VTLDFRVMMAVEVFLVRMEKMAMRLLLSNYDNSFNCITILNYYGFNPARER